MKLHLHDQSWRDQENPVTRQPMIQLLFLIWEGIRILGTWISLQDKPGMLNPLLDLLVFKGTGDSSECAVCSGRENNKLVRVSKMHFSCFLEINCYGVWPPPKSK